MVRRLAVWIATVLLVALTGRTLAYALAPASPLRASLAGRLGGPGPLVAALAGFALASALAAAVLWLAALGVRERHRLAAGPSGPAPRLRLRSVPGRAAGLWAASALVFTVVEGYLHWRAGMGIHGLHCLVGPVHQSAVPILAALSVLAAAAWAAAELVLGWMRRTVRLILATPARRPLRPGPAHGTAPRFAPAVAPPRPARPRAPPAASVSLAG
jgi:hypothetical protein